MTERRLRLRPGANKKWDQTFDRVCVCVLAKLISNWYNARDAHTVNS